MDNARLLKNLLCLLSILLIVGCAEEPLLTHQESSPYPPGLEGDESTQQKDLDSKKETVAKLPSPPEKRSQAGNLHKTTPIRRIHPFSNYLKAPRTEIDYWRAKTQSLVINNILGKSSSQKEYRKNMFGPSLGEFLHLLNPIGYAVTSSKEALQSQLNEIVKGYEGEMDSEYYFARVLKFRAPESASKANYYSCYLMVSPELSDTHSSGFARERRKIYVSEAEYLEPGEAGSGIGSIIVIPRKEVQSLMGYWNQEVTVQLGIIERKPKYSEKEINELDTEELINHAIVFNRKVKFWNATEDKIYSYRYVTKQKNGLPNSAIDVDFWKGSWKSNW